MKKRSVITALLCSICLAAGSAVPAMADASRVVTLGADLTQDQKNTMMQYFKADSSQVQILTVTNADEREYLGSYIPLEQIGTRTLSCAYVKPTQSGGIKVRTANLNYVTGKMIANALSTAGVSNCEAVAACPYEVSGTGALTGVMMAYESASGQKLDSSKKDLATKEVVVTGNLAQQVGEDNATNIINQAKLQIIGENVQNADEIYNIVNNIAVENNVTFSPEEMDAIVSLLQQIAQQSYDIEQMKNTLEEIQASIDKENDPQAEETPAPEDGAEEDGEDITENVDPDVLGDDIKESSTEDPTLAEETMGDENVENESSENETGIPEATEDGSMTEESAGDTYTEEMGIPEATEDGSMTEETTGDTYTEEMGIPEASEDGSMTEETTGDTYTEEMGIPEASEDGTMTEETAGDTAAASFNTDALSEEAKTRFDSAKTFCAGEYEGDAVSLQTAMNDPAAVASVSIDPATGASLTQKVLETYLSVLNDGGMSYVPSGAEMYMSSELNMLDSQLKTVFSIDAEPSAEDILASQPAETRQALYNDTMKFFANLYGETVDTATASAEAAGEEVYTEEGYTEEGYTEEGYTEEVYTEEGTY